MNAASTLTRHRVLFLAHSHIFGPFRVGSHHYAREFARAGAEVVHLSTPISSLHRAPHRGGSRSAGVSPTSVTDSDGVTHIVPGTLMPRPFGPFRIDRELKRHGISSDFDTVLVDQPLLWDASVPAMGRQLIYRPTDVYPSGLKARLQRKLLARADAIVATSDEVLRAAGPVAVPALVLENGVELNRFFPGNTEPGFACVYVGALDHRFDWATLAELARSTPEERFAIAGPRSSARPALPDNVHMVGPIRYEEVPSLLRAARVGLLPFTDTPLNAGRSPMKLNEYLASGLAVVARATPTVSAEERAGVYTYDSIDTARAALARALQHPTPNLGGVLRAQEQGWTAKAETLRGFLASLRDQSE